MTTVETLTPPIGADTYQEQLKDPRWYEKREKIFQRDGYTCFSCGSKENLRCHHLYYQGKVWEVPDSYLQTLCQACHEKLGPHHKGGVFYEKVGETVKIVFGHLTIALPNVDEWVFFYHCWTMEGWVVTPGTSWPEKHLLVNSAKIVQLLGRRSSHCLLVPYIDATGRWGLWPIKKNAEGWAYDWAHSAWAEVCKNAGVWVAREKNIGSRRAYSFRIRPHQLPKPEWAKEFFEGRIWKYPALGERQLISDESHPVYRELMGLA
jgi:hypothetical protein